MAKFDHKIARSRAVKLNRSELESVISAFVQRGANSGYGAWKKCCAKGVRKGKLDESSVDQCITHVCQEVDQQCREDDGSPMSDTDLRKMPKRLRADSEKFVDR